MENQGPRKEDISGVPQIQRMVKDYDPTCHHCRQDDPAHHVFYDGISRAIVRDLGGKEIPPTVMLVRHSTEPRAEELRHLQEIAEMIWPGMTWRQENRSTAHFFLQAEG